MPAETSIHGARNTRVLERRIRSWWLRRELDRWNELGTVSVGERARLWVMRVRLRVVCVVRGHDIDHPAGAIYCMRCLRPLEGGGADA